MAAGILISACLAGDRVRYDGKVIAFRHPLLDQWHKKGCLYKFCPEVEGGLPVPRPPAEIVQGNGNAVLQGAAAIYTQAGVDVTAFFLKGAQKALDFAERLGIHIAILKQGSPSCGSAHVYDGSFSRTRKPGQGVAAALLAAKGIAVFAENEIELAARHL